jgi:hypothetical protein
MKSFLNHEERFAAPPLHQANVIARCRTDMALNQPGISRERAFSSLSDKYGA